MSFEKVENKRRISYKNERIVSNHNELPFCFNIGAFKCNISISTYISTTMMISSYFSIVKNYYLFASFPSNSHLFSGQMRNKRRMRSKIKIFFGELIDCYSLLLPSFLQNKLFSEEVNILDLN